MAPYPVLVHPFPSPTSSACAYELGNSSSHNALVFIGGLGDGPHTVPYVKPLADKLGATEGLSYSVFEFRLSSSFTGFGYHSLKDDVADISALVKYLRGLGKQKIVLMGHSTGCQDCMEYTDNAKHHNERVDGFILQGPVSDPEAIALVMDEVALKESLEVAAEMIKSGRENDIVPRSKLPSFFDSPITAYRWQALAAPGGEDDYFSVDIDEAKLATFWGRFQSPVLIVPSGEDEHVSKSRDVARDINLWKSLCAPGIASDLSDIIPGASHNVKQSEPQLWLADRVGQFLKSLQGN